MPNSLWPHVMGMGFPGGSDTKESAHSVGDLGLISGLRRSPGEGNGYPLQYSCLENSRDRGPSGLQFMDLQRVRDDWATNNFIFNHNFHCSFSVFRHLWWFHLFDSVNGIKWMSVYTLLCLHKCTYPEYIPNDRICIFTLICINRLPSKVDILIWNIYSEAKPYVKGILLN